jgi:predicted phosphodiesterase
MRYALVSDLHANLQAWNAVLLDSRANRIDQIVCLGDIVGYGPNPAEVLQSAYENIDHFVLGNHDAVIAGKLDAELFNAAARDLITWTQSNLSPDAITFLRTLPLSLDGGTFRCVHADAASPGAFNYVIDAEDALASWAAVPHPLIFVGHTHCPAIYVVGASGTPYRLDPQDFALEAGKRFLVNAGSVGLPRDGDARASYCVYDTVAATVCWRRIPFDLDAYRDALDTAGLTHDAAGFLRHDPRRAAVPLRDQLLFSPPRQPGKQVRDAVEVCRIDELQRDVHRWKRSFSLLLILLLVATAAAGHFTWRHLHRRLVIGPAMPAAALHSDEPPDEGLVPRIAMPHLGPEPDWLLDIGNRYRQTITVDSTRDYGDVFVLASDTPREEMRISAPAIRVPGSGRFQMQAAFRRSDDFAGSVVLAASVTRRNGGTIEEIRNYRVKEPSIRRREGWLRAQETFDLPAGAETLQIHVLGRFRGSVRVAEVTLLPRE